MRSVLALMASVMVTIALAAPAPNVSPNGANSRKLLGGGGKKKCRVLALSGGGSYGVFEAGVLSMLSEKSGGKLDYDYMTGISAGSINAVYLSTFKQGATEFSTALAELKQLWISLKDRDVYSWDPIGIWTSQSIYNTAPLRATLKRFLSQRPKPLTIERGVTIGTSNMATGMMKYVDRELLQTDPVGWAMASSAIPLLFEPQHMNGTVFVDGGTLSNEILGPAIAQCPPDAEVELDLILCSPRIGKLPGSTVQKFNFQETIGRVVEMVTNQLSNHVLDYKCKDDSTSRVKVNQYTPQGDDNHISIIEFSKGQYIWDAGYNRSMLQEWYYCPIRSPAPN